VLLTALPTSRLLSQGVLNQFSYDSLRLSGVQGDLGVLGASRLRGTVVGGVRMDWGRVAPHVRVLVGLSYFKGAFDRQATDELARRLRPLVSSNDPNFTINLGRITWSDLTADLDLQYVLPQGRTVTAYLGAGLGLHFMHGSGAAINGTFVQDALDGVAAGLNGTVGFEIATGSAWRFTVEGRGVASTQLSTAALRAGLMYRLPRAR
jgi:Outer membrane protein beta-barrel domain